jgi:dihydroorotate dehydrogenase
LYTSLGYKGPGIVVSMKEEITDLLKKEGKTWKDLIGSDHRNSA